MNVSVRDQPQEMQPARLLSQPIRLRLSVFLAYQIELINLRMRIMIVTEVRNPKTESLTRSLPADGITRKPSVTGSGSGNTESQIFFFLNKSPYLRAPVHSSLTYS